MAQLVASLVDDQVLPEVVDSPVSEWDRRTMAVLGLDSRRAIVMAVRASDEAVAICMDEELVALWGHNYKDFVAGVGRAWLITTPAMERHKRSFAFRAYKVVGYLMGIYSRLEVIVDAEFLQSIAWLERMGFKSYLPAVRLNDHPFILMAKER